MTEREKEQKLKERLKAYSGPSMEQGVAMC